MKFRSYDVDVVKVIKATTSKELEQQIVALDHEFIVMDLQYNVCQVIGGVMFSALALLQRRKK